MSSVSLVVAIRQAIQRLTGAPPEQTPPPETMASTIPPPPPGPAPNLLPALPALPTPQPEASQPEEAPQPPRQKGPECKVCFSAIADTAVCLQGTGGEHWEKTNECSHRFCRDCLVTYVQSEIASMKRKIRCPEPECQYMLYSDDIRNLSSPAAFAKYQEARDADYASRMDEIAADEGMRAWLASDGRQSHAFCPACHVLIERSEGCNFMKCICDTEFCIVCRMIYDPDDPDATCECDDDDLPVMQIHLEEAAAAVEEAAPLVPTPATAIEVEVEVEAETAPDVFAPPPPLLTVPSTGDEARAADAGAGAGFRRQKSHDLGSCVSADTGEVVLKFFKGVLTDHHQRLRTRSV